MTTVAVVGGGASGVLAAVEASRLGCQVCLYEAGPRVLKKVLASGNGRCNFTNSDIMPSDYNRPEFVAEAMNCVTPEDVMRYFADLGLLAFEEEEGRVYPYSGKATTVVDLLLWALEEAGVDVHTSTRVIQVRPAASDSPGNRQGWDVLTEGPEGSRESVSFDRVIMSVGGAPDASLVPEDVKYIRTSPVLCALKTDTDNLKGLSGIKVRARVYLDEDPTDLQDAWLDVVDPEFEADYCGPEEYGEVLFRDYGVSGIAVFNMSRLVRPGQMVFLDLLCDLDPQAKVDFIWDQSMAHPDRSIHQVLSGALPSRLARNVIVAAGLNPDEPIIAEEEAVVLAMVCESFGLKVKGVADPKQAQVTRGGWAVKGFIPQTMESKKHPGLFATGEALDVDGKCGGYNLHWAWTSGIIAGRSAAQG